MRGFTLLEVLITLCLVAFIGGFSLIVSMDVFRRSTFQQDRNLLVAALERARAQAQHNICLGTNCMDGEPHGVALVRNTYVLFQGRDYANRDIEQDDRLENNASIHRTGNTEIVFSQLSATTSGGVITLSDEAGRMSVISIAQNGRISWTH
jgi:Tfp pilus assembly protein FimT